MKNHKEAPSGKLIANEILERLWTYLTVNFITKLSLVTGKNIILEKNIILVVCNRLSKIAHFVAITERTLAEGLASLFRNNV